MEITKRKISKHGNERWEIDLGPDELGVRRRPLFVTDPDGEGFNNLQEYLAGTNPQDAASFLKLDSAVVAGSGINLAFTAVAGKTYSVLWKGDLSSGIWLKLADVPAQNVTGSVTVTDAGPHLGQRFYRLITPQQAP